MSKFKEKEIQQTLKDIQTYGSVSLLGVLGLGKGLFLRHLAKKDSGKFKIIYLNFSEVTYPKELNLFKLLALKLGKIIKSTDPQKILFETQALIKVSSQHYHLLIIFDTVESLFNQSGLEILEKLRSLQEENKNHLFYLFGIKDSPPQFEKFLKKSWTAQNLLGRKVVRLTPLSLNDTKSFIGESTNAKSSNKIESELIQKIFQVSGGHAGLLKDLVRFTITKNILGESDFIKHENELLRDATLFNRCQSIYQDFKSPALPFSCPIYEKIVTNLLKVSPAKIYFDSQTNQIYKHSQPLNLSSQEFRLLKFLLQNQEKVITRDAIAQNIWQTKIGVSDQAIDKLVARVRKKIEENPSDPKLLFTIRGRGFRLTPVPESPAFSRRG